MKIGFVLDDGLDKPDGVQQYIRTLGEYFEKQGHEVRYLVGETSRQDLSGVYSMAKNIKVRFNGNALSVPAYASVKYVKKILAEEELDVIHVQVPYHPFMGAQVVKHAAKNVAVVGTFHILPYGLASTFGTHILGWWLKRNLRRFDAMVSVSKPAQIFAKKHFGVESKIIPNSVNINVYKPLALKKKNNHSRILFLGRLVERKGCRQLIESLIILRDRAALPNNYKIDICGSGPDRSSLEKFVRDNKLEDIITFHGFVSDKQKIHFMQQADISIFPSLSGESFGIVLIEAMAAGGGIVLAGNNPGYESVLGEIKGSIVDAKHPQVMADQLLKYINNPKLVEELHAKQQMHVQQFDTPKVGNQLLEMYQACIEMRNS